MSDETDTETDTDEDFEMEEDSESDSDLPKVHPLLLEHVCLLNTAESDHNCY